MYCTNNINYFERKRGEGERQTEDKKITAHTIVMEEMGGVFVPFKLNIIALDPGDARKRQ